MVDKSGSNGINPKWVVVVYEPGVDSLNNLQNKAADKLGGQPKECYPIDLRSQVSPDSPVAKFVKKLEAKQVHIAEGRLQYAFKRRRTER